MVHSGKNSHPYGLPVGGHKSNATREYEAKHGGGTKDDDDDIFLRSGNAISDENKASRELRGMMISLKKSLNKWAENTPNKSMELRQLLLDLEVTVGTIDQYLWDNPF